MSRPRVTQLILILAAAGLLVAAGMLQFPLDRLSEGRHMVPPGNVVAETNPQLALLTTVCGWLRAPMVSVYWIRAEQQKQAGRHFEAMQTADLICQLMPNFPGVWDFHAWNMAWNISVTTHTPEERWLWVTNGMKLLRDRGIPLNPQALPLYKQLAWIFYDKMGGFMDEMHWEYKKRWAMEMQALLGAPPPGTTGEVISAFRPIAAAGLLDKDPRRQGRHEIQPDKFAELLKSQPVRGYLEELRKRFAAGDAEFQSQPLIKFAAEHLLDIYNRYSLDESVAVARRGPPALETEADKNLFAWINSRELAEFRRELVTFVRAQRLWNVYKMDPHWMLQLMEQYNVPIDWRIVRAHGLYWASYGVHVCGNADIEHIDSINTDRILLFCLRDMTYYGKLVFQGDLADPEAVSVAFLADWRFIEPAHREYIHWGMQERTAGRKDFKENIFRDGHINYLVDTIEMLYAGSRRNKARELLDWIVANYRPEGKDWEIADDLDAFVRYRLAADLKEGSLTLEDAVSQMAAAIQAGFESLVRGSSQEYQQSIEYAAYIHDTYMKQAPQRLRIPPFQVYLANTLAYMLARPETLGAHLDLADRVILYNKVDSDPQGSKLLLMIYDRVAPTLQWLCAQNGLDFQSSFPPPPGLKEYRQRLKGLSVPTK
jgi:hypothetical protein